MPKKRYTPERSFNISGRSSWRPAKGWRCLTLVGCSGSPSTRTTAGRKNTVGCAWIKPSGRRGWSRRICASSGLSPTKYSICRSSRKSPREASEPGPQARGRGARRHRAPCVRAQGVSGDRPDPVLLSVRATARSVSRAVARADHRIGQGVRAVWLPNGHGSLEARGMGCGQRSRVYNLAARRPQSAHEAAQASQTLACRWVVHPAAARLPQSRLVV